MVIENVVGYLYGVDMTKEVMQQAIEALYGFIPYLPLKDENQCNKYDKAIKALEEELKQEENNFGCKTHPDAPHGFVREASYLEGGYICECEFWNPPEQDEPVAYINVEQRKLEWAKPIVWETPTVANLPKIPLYTTPQKGCAECGVGGGYALYCLSCAEKFIGNKEWVRLTDNQLVDLVIKNAGFPTKLAEAIEAKLKEKNT